MTFIIDIFRAKTDVPIVHKLMGSNLTEPEIKRICLNKTDIPSFDCYAFSKEHMDWTIDNLVTWMNNDSYSMDGWWCMELNVPVWIAEASMDNFNTEFIC